MTAMNAPELFRGTSSYYVRYRPNYPANLFAYIVERFDLDGSGRLLDVGCGPGNVSLALAPHFEEVIGMDPLAEMLEAANHIAHTLGITNVMFHKGSSADLVKMAPALGQFRLVTMGRSFHWMDREATLKALWPMIMQGGGIAVVSTLRADFAEPYQSLITDICTKWVSRAPNRDRRQRNRHHEDVISKSQFTRIERREFHYSRLVDIETVLGHLYSTSGCAPPIFGENLEAFDKDMRQTLLAKTPTGTIEQTLGFDAILAWRD